MTIQIGSNVHLALALWLEAVDPVSRTIAGRQNQGMFFNAYNLTRRQVSLLIQWRDVINLGLNTIDDHVANWEWTQTTNLVINTISWQAIVNALLFTTNIW